MKINTKGLSEYFDQLLKFFTTELAGKVIDETIISFAQKVDLKSKLSCLIEKQNEFNKVFYYSSSDTAESFFAIGSVLSICENGADRFLKTEDRVKTIFNKIIDNHSGLPEISIPLFLGAAKFDYGNSDPLWSDYSDSEWFIPKYLIISKGNENFLVINSIFNKGDSISEFESKEIDEIKKNIFDETVKIDQDLNSVGLVEDEKEKDKKKEDPEWLFNVEKAIELIKVGELRKIVLSRIKTIRLIDEIGLSTIYKKLSRSKNECNKYLYKSGDSIFIGCSPEKLFSITNNILKTEAVAGSIKRGLSTEDDDQLSLSLLSSSKEKEEHQYVVDFLLSRIKKYGDAIEYPDKLQIKKTQQLQHLWLPIQCELKKEFSLFAIINDLFPTPAVCGIPKEDAYKIISGLEKYKRGLFTGIIGWFNKNKTDIAVGIRSALINKKRCYLFAGCGIVAGSDPKAEYNETELKMETILSILKDEDQS
jgi:menaquinone-specific isochorismate synthase